MSLSALTPVKSAAADAAAATGNAASKAKSSAFDSMLQSLRGGAPAAQADASGTSGTATKVGSDETEDRFLKLLVAQMRNQDPLNPLDNAQVTNQLAAINTVKGIDKLNESLQKLVDRGETGSPAEAAAVVGRRVLVEGDALELPEGGTAKAGFDLAAPAASVKVELIGRDGRVADTRQFTNLPAGLQAFEWDGKTAEGRLDPGRYTMRVSASDAGAAVEATPLTAVPVLAVTRGADGATLQLGAHGSRALDDVRAIL